MAAREDLAANQSVTQAGIVPSFEAAHTDGDMFPNSGSEILYIKNGGGGTVVVTIISPKTVDSLAVADLTVSIATGVDKMIGKLTPDTFNQPSGADAGKVYVDYDGVASVTVGVFKA